MPNPLRDHRPAVYSETVDGLLDRREKRIGSLDRDATLASGPVVTAGILTGVGVELARGGDPWPCAWLGAPGGATCLVALVVLRLRR